MREEEKMRHGIGDHNRNTDLIDEKAFGKFCKPPNYKNYMNLGSLSMKKNQDKFEQKNSKQKYRIRETPTLSTDGDSSTIP